MLSIRSPITSSAPYVLEVVGQVRVGHDDVLALGGGEPGQVRAAVAAARLVDDVGAGLLGALGAAVGGPVVGHDDLAGQPVGLQRVPRGGHAALDRPGLVEARDDD
jgi:hypothetical protein